MEMLPTFRCELVSLIPINSIVKEEKRTGKCWKRVGSSKSAPMALVFLITLLLRPVRELRTKEASDKLS
jgi:hypothetical protein